MTPEEQQQVNAALQVDANDIIEGSRAQMREQADKALHWFGLYMAATRRIKQLEAKVKELTPKEETKLEVVA